MTTRLLQLTRPHYRLLSLPLQKPFNIKRQMSFTGPSPFNSYLNTITKSLQQNLQTCFHFQANEIDIIESPSQFYDLLKSKILSSQNRIFIASLYLGKSETELVDCISQALSKNPNLKVSFLLDGLRGTRELPSTCSATLLSSLVAKYGSQRVDCRLYKTPAYRGWKKVLVPKRFNEGLGLQHMKIYGFDNEVILSGANLSNDYFTNRQDRYYLFKSRNFSNYYFKLHQLIILNKASQLLPTGQFSTIVYPISQFTPLFPKYNDKSTEKSTILSLLSNITNNAISWTFTAGYFNILPDIKAKLLATPVTEANVITASPFANGFYQSKGVSSNLPGAYLYLSKKFLQDVSKYNQDHAITLREWQRGVVNKPNGWSYHAKGIWLSTRDKSDSDNWKPFITVIGSSNYTRRAYSLDLESNALIITRDEELRKKMKAELDNLLQYTKPVTLEDFQSDPKRHIGTGVKIATSVLGKKL
ncbi:CRE_collapsed_G0005460.mRNA.1.CDS.1 [Saccharomyces cerevisiae]|nr:CRE_collapsed_G0005460.mRNA.1.CDS.1 [Saccharomyces cerevisiae]